VLARWLPYWRIKPSLADPWLRFQIDVVHCLWAILPAALLWGTSFPLALAAAARHGQDPGRLAGRVYAANTAGAIVGAVAFAMVVIPGLGTQHSQQFLTGLSAVAAVVALGPLLRGRRGPVCLAASLVAVALLVWKTPAVPWGVMAYGRQLPTRTLQGELLYLGEGMNASVVVSDLYKTLRFHVSGKVEASTDQQDMRVQRMLGHIPALLHPQPRSVLVVGCGAGVTAGSFVTHPEVERIVICEIELLIPRAAERYFGRENHDVMRNLRTEVVHDDARHYILTTRDTFDIITSDPIHPWVKGSATLYTREYFELCKRHLKPGGFITQWVPLYESSLETVKSELATFFEVFPNGIIWGNDTAFEEGYDVVLMGQAGTATIDVDELQRRLDRPDHAAVVKSLRELGFVKPVHLLGTYAGRARDLRPWLSGAQINRDRNLRLQYLAGIGSRSQGAVFIYEEILRHVEFPEDLFVASSEAGAALRRMLRRP
jgi:spermidine synthase